MALKGKLGGEVEIQSSAAKFFNVFIAQLHELQNITDVVHHTKLHQGDWHGVGSHSVKHWTFTLGILIYYIYINLPSIYIYIVLCGKVVNCKEHIDEIDHGNKTMLFNVFDGVVSEKYKMLKAKLKVVGKSEGAIAKWTWKFEKVHEAIPPPQDYMDYIIKLTKDVDAKLLKA
ncbi:MLP-like protein 34 [Senna tora]|uniref:MLP-like protein 34 n=1 Tax=Senna tora TaxID=362788 RepID=A0A834SS99_9FABA|nr:MLP-like protein 34 [Senna tora]